MKLNKNSWHYRLVYDFYNTESYSLCTHFWRIVFALLFTFVIALLGAGIIILFCFVIYKSISENPGAFFSIVGFAICSFICLCGAFIWYDYRSKNLGREPKTLFGKWWKAKKEKVCPVIKWEYKE